MNIALRDMQEWGMSDDEVMAALGSAWKQQGELTSRVVALLAVVEERRLFLKHAQPSLFDLCTRKLGMHEGEACRRITAARLALKFPQILSALHDQRIHLTALLLLKEILEKGHHDVDAVLAAASGKSKREVQELIAKLAPKPDVEDSIRKQPAPRAVAAAAAASAAASGPASVTPSSTAPLSSAASRTIDLFEAAPTARSSFAGGTSSTEATPTPSLHNSQVLAALGSPEACAGSAGFAIPPSAQIVPLSESRYKIQFTATSGLIGKLERARSLMRHQNVRGDLAVVVERALDLLIAELEKKQLAATSRPRKSALTAATASKLAAAASVRRRERGRRRERRERVESLESYANLPIRRRGERSDLTGRGAARGTGQRAARSRAPGRRAVLLHRRRRQSLPFTRHARDRSPASTRAWWVQRCGQPSAALPCAQPVRSGEHLRTRHGRPRGRCEPPPAKDEAGGEGHRSTRRRPRADPSAQIGGISAPSRARP